jgi:hypothetical protein
VHVVWHQAGQVQPYRAERLGFLHALQKPAAVQVIPENEPTLVATEHHMVQRASNWTRSSRAIAADFAAPRLGC